MPKYLVTPFKKFDLVEMSTRPGIVFIITKVNEKHDHDLGTTVDMGRYTLQTSWGSIAKACEGQNFYNMPGYLMRLAPKKEKAA